MVGNVQRIKCWWRYLPNKTKQRMRVNSKTDKWNAQNNTMLEREN